MPMTPPTIINNPNSMNSNIEKLINETEALGRVKREKKLTKDLIKITKKAYSGGSAPNFNKGDRVALLFGEYYPDQDFPFFGHNGDNIYGQVVEIDRHDGDIRVNWDNGGSEWFPISQFILIHADFLLDNISSSSMKKVKLDTSKLDPLVIKQETKEELISVLKQHNNSDKMFDEWGLGEVVEYGKGMTMLFHGTPGTGKTWGATCISRAVGQELLVINGANIQTSEPGGACRNIENAFKSAREQNKVLFLDECDSLITARNDVGMIIGMEINTLLTEIEKFEGVCILATNRIDTLDEALERRISLIVEFPKPDQKAREAIWEKHLPEKMPREKAVTPKALAKIELTGGQIKNVVLQAARLALADEEDKVKKKHFDRAIKRLLKSKDLMGSRTRRYSRGGHKTDYKTDVETDKG